MTPHESAKLLAAALLALAASAAPAQDRWPQKPITIVVPSAAGGAADIIGRTLGNFITRSIPGSTVVVDNKAGAGGILGTEAAKKAAPDGYTYLISTNSTHAANLSLYRSVPYDPLKDFDSIGMFGTYGMLLLVQRESALGSVPQLIQHAKSNPGKLTFGFYSSSSQVPAELFKTSAKIQYLGAPYKNVTQIVTDLIGGRLDFAFLDSLSADAALQNQKLRAIAVSTTARLPSLPDVPTVAETLPGYEVQGWFGLTAPAGTPRPILDRMSKLMVEAVADPTLRTALEQRRMTVASMTPAQMRQFIAEDIARWARWASIAGIEPQ